MKVIDLIAKLQMLDPHAEVLGCCEDAGDGSPGSSCDFYLAERVDSARVVIGRDKTGTPTVTADHGPGSRSVVVIDLLSKY